MDEKTPDGGFEGPVLHEERWEGGYAVFGEFLDYASCTCVSVPGLIWGGDEGVEDVRTVNAIPSKWPIADIAINAGRAFVPADSP